ncbi:nicotinate-nucleotide--dimethylbenzimidazole phosphoribosyltransferase [uncultured Jatrophihabitans sp.]|uniref:nicotinate-nucleotide--dimethylbenzimidazole phosphoribosyltransferase n=1 Tax=uncultured Jatrophihabitans sp. TaxID=1610747 RepID=UPI0035C95765
MGEPVTEARASIDQLAARIGDADLSARPAQGDRDPRDGRLGELGHWLSGLLTGEPTRIRLLLLGEPSEAVLQAAESADVAVHPLPLPDAQLSTAIAAGAAAADAAVDAGVDLVLLAAPADELPAAATIGALTAAEPVALLPRGAAAVDTAHWIAGATYLRDIRRRIVGLRERPDELLATLGSPTLAAATAVALAAAARRTPVVLDGLSAVAGALLGAQSHPRARRWWLVADSSPDPAHRRAVAELDATPVLDFDTARGDGLAAVLGVPLLRAATRLQPAALT